MKHGGMSPGMGSSSPWLWTKQSRNKQDEDKAVKESEMSVRWSLRKKKIHLRGKNPCVMMAAWPQMSVRQKILSKSLWIYENKGKLSRRQKKLQGIL